MATKSENSGWICLHRAFKDWQHYSEPMVKIVFLDLLLNANHKDGWWHGHKCERGATFVSIRAIAQNNCITTKTVQRALKVLVETGEIQRVKIDQKSTKTIIVKYNVYQDISGFIVVNEDTQSNTQSSTQGNTQSNTQSSTEQQYNNNNKKNNDNNEAAADAERLVADLMAQGIHIEAFCKNERLTLDQCRSIAEAVVTDWELIDEPDRSRKHLMAAIRIKAQAMRKQGQLHTTTKAERRAAFIAECRELLAKGFRRDAVAEFASYYTQETSEGQMLFETYPAWNTETRFRINLQRQRQ